MLPLRTRDVTNDIPGKTKVPRSQARVVDRTQGKSGKKPIEDNEVGKHAPDTTSDPDRVQATVYDAVAGRFGHGRFILNGSAKPDPPDHVLFSRSGAPIRYEENDQYFANRDLPPGATLPDSDMLKTIHAYVSDFYGSGAVGDAKADFESMDETALIALGILLEEAAAKSLGSTGDLAFVEGEEELQAHRT